MRDLEKSRKKSRTSNETVIQNTSPKSDNKNTGRRGTVTPEDYLEVFAKNQKEDSSNINIEHEDHNVSSNPSSPHNIHGENTECSTSEDETSERPNEEMTVKKSFEIIKRARMKLLEDDEERSQFLSAKKMLRKSSGNTITSRSRTKLKKNEVLKCKYKARGKSTDTLQTAVDPPIETTKKKKKTGIMRTQKAIKHIEKEMEINKKRKVRKKRK